jgi:transmembrane sensor
MPAFINRLAELMVKYLRGELSDKEKNELGQVINESEENRLLFQRLTDEIYLNKELNRMSAINLAPGWKKIKASGIIQTGKRRWLKYVAVAAAVAALIISAIAIYFNLQKPDESAPVTETKNTIPEKTIPHTHNRGRLILADNRIVSLATLKDGEVSVQGNSRVAKKGKHYSYTMLQNAEDTVHNTFVADKGGDFQLTLSDGTKVSLNSGSSIRFPVHFGRERKVEIVGEAFFEVTENTSKPFIVTSGYAEAEVLGTDFNIKAHTGDSIITTVVSGSVKVSSGGKSETVSPGKQIVVSRSGKLGKPKEAKIDRVTAWKNGKFDFRDQDLPVILAELGRWYNLEVDLSKVPNVKRAGVYPRSIPIIEVLIHLSAPSDVQLKLEGNKIVVY